MRVRLLSFILCIVFSSLLFGQGAFNTTSSAEKFNRRGYYKNDAIAKNNHEIVSDFDGNLMLHYSTQVDLPYDLGADFTITYNPNVEHRVFTEMANGYNNYFYSMGIALNSPEWILGFKGFALQTFNFESYYKSPWLPNGRINYYKKELAMMIPGYHYSNFYGNLNDVNDGSVTRDYITILRADGSKMILRNSENPYIFGQTIGTQHYSGFYVEEGNETKGFAVVKINSGETNSDIKRRLRTIEYRAGDGLVYVFTESKAHIEDLTDQYNNRKVIYLSKIYNPAYNDNNGNPPYVSFAYADGVDAGMYTYKLHTKKVFTGMSYQCAAESINQIEMVWHFNQNYNSFVSPVIKNLRREENIMLDMGARTFSHALDSTRTSTYGRQLYPEKIRYIKYTGEYSYDTVKKDSIKYNTSSVYAPTTTRMYNYEGVFRYTDSAYVPSSITYYNGQKSEFEYYPTLFTGGTYLYLNISGGSQFSTENWGVAERDCFTNYMLKWRKIYNSSSVLTRQEDYSYSMGNQRGSAAKDSLNQNITVNATDLITTIAISDQLPFGRAINTKTRYFNKLNTSFRNYSANFDAAQTTKLMAESDYSNIDESPAILKTYSYDLGNYYRYGMPGWNCFDGSFLLARVITQESKLSQTCTDTVKTGYTFTTINFGSDLFKKKVISSDTTMDAKSLYKYNEYKNFIYSEDGNTYYYSGDGTYPDYYKIGLPLTQKVYGKSSPNATPLVVSHNTYIYSTTTSSTGDGREISNLLHQINTNNQSSSRTTSTYFWYCPLYDTSVTQQRRLMLLPGDGNTNSYYPGLLRFKYMPKGYKERYVYPNSSTNPIYPVVVPRTGANYTITYIPGARYFLPWKTELTFGSDTLSSYKSYTSAGYVTAEVDPNKVYSCYNYDYFGRIKYAAFPGSFESYSTLASPLSDIASYNSIYYNYYDTQNKITGLSNRDFSLDKTFEFEDQYDALGNLISKKEKNDNNTMEQLSNKTYNGFDQLASEDIYAAGTSSKVSKNYSYDGLGRVLSVNTGSATQYRSYDVNSGYFTRNNKTVYYYRSITITDEEGKTVTTYFDKPGQKVAEKIGSNNPTLFIYNEAYQLTIVVTPEGKETTYSYDDLGFLSSKTSPDEGTYNYKYSKYGELRYQFHTSQTPATLLYHNYDPLGRLEVTGTRSISSSDFNSLDPDVNSTNDNNAANMVLVNVYDDISVIGSAYYSAVFSGFSLPENVTLNNVKGRLAITAYRNTTSSPWSYKAYSYNPQGQIEKEHIKENVN